VTAVGLARLGYELALVCRDPKKAEQTLQEIGEAAPGAKVELFMADLSSQQEIRKLASEFRAKHDKLHLLVNNAGLLLMERRVTVDGFEATFATNHLGYFLLTNLLLDLLKAGRPARVVNVASGAHASGKIDFDDLNAEKHFSGFQAYCNSKLMNVLFTFELSRRLEGTGVTANCVHPGAVASNWGQNDGTRWFRPLMKLAKPFLLTPEKGARTSLYVASSPEVEGVTGKYFYKCAPKRTSRRSQDLELQRKLWDVSAKLTGLS
jgi:NAD(P)-dependent dehydrogenase (short-subunit alcohol dehydrogenase family)